MIRPLRRRHRAIFVGLALLLPALFVAGLASRRPAPLDDALPALGGVVDPEGTPSFAAGPELWSGLPIRTWIFSDASGVRGSRLILEALEELKWPELLVYWTAAPVDSSGPLPPDVHLLGVFRRGVAPAELELPVAAASRSGTLVLYGLARQEIAGQAELPVIGADS